MTKRYYWLKLQEDFFGSLRIKKLRKLAGGDTYVIIYLKMQLLSLKNDGILKYTGIESTFAEELALDLDEEPDNVLVVLNFLAQNGMIESYNNSEFLLPYVCSNTGTESDSAKRVREFRGRQSGQKALQCNADVTPCNKNVTLEIEKEIRDKSNIKDIDHFDPAERRDQKADRPKKSDDPSKDNRFMAFWQQYPRKEKKATAYKAWLKLKVDDGKLAEILTGLNNWIACAQWQDKQYIPHPATFLNAKQWQDDPVDIDEQRKKEAWINGENIDGW